MPRAPAILAVVGALVCSLPRCAAAQDAFEIQVYDSETAPPADFGLEVHLNYFASGSTVASPEGELPTDHVTHLTFEPHVGLTAGAKRAPTSRRRCAPTAASTTRASSCGSRPACRDGSVVASSGWRSTGELSAVPRSYEPTGLGGELRPIVDIAWRRLYASVNPILAFDFFGADAGHPQLEPAATLLVALAEGWAMGVEYYAALGPIDRPLPADRQVHRLFMVATATHKWWGVHVGGGYGLAAGEKWIASDLRRKLVADWLLARPRAHPAARVHDSGSSSYASPSRAVTVAARVPAGEAAGWRGARRANTSWYLTDEQRSQAEWIDSPAGHKLAGSCTKAPAARGTGSAP